MNGLTSLRALSEGVITLDEFYILFDEATSKATPKSYKRYEDMSPGEKRQYDEETHRIKEEVKELHDGRARSDLARQREREENIKKHEEEKAAKEAELDKRRERLAKNVKDNGGHINPFGQLF